MTITKPATIRTHLIAILILVTVDNLNAQWTDYGLWSGAGISQDVFENFSYEVETQARWDYDFSRLGSAFTDVGISQDLSPFAPDFKDSTTFGFRTMENRRLRKRVRFLSIAISIVFKRRRFCKCCQASRRITLSSFKKTEGDSFHRGLHASKRFGLVL